jgi:hypothetical protein
MQTPKPKLDAKRNQIETDAKAKLAADAKQKQTLMQLN